MLSAGPHPAHFLALNVFCLGPPGLQICCTLKESREWSFKQIVLTFRKAAALLLGRVQKREPRNSDHANSRRRGGCVSCLQIPGKPALQKCPRLSVWPPTFEEASFQLHTLISEHRNQRKRPSFPAICHHFLCRHTHISEHRNQRKKASRYQEQAQAQLCVDEDSSSCRIACIRLCIDKRLQRLSTEPVACMRVQRLCVIVR
eukprot:1160358-Pelagomonas_calceolata.AAC.2